MRNLHRKPCAISSQRWYTIATVALLLSDIFCSLCIGHNMVKSSSRFTQNSVSNRSTRIVSIPPLFLLKPARWSTAYDLRAALLASKGSKRSTWVAQQNILEAIKAFFLPYRRIWCSRNRLSWRYGLRMALTTLLKAFSINVISGISSFNSWSPWESHETKKTCYSRGSAARIFQATSISGLLVLEKSFRVSISILLSIQLAVFEADSFIDLAHSDTRWKERWSLLNAHMFRIFSPDWCTTLSSESYG